MNMYFDRKSQNIFRALKEKLNEALQLKTIRGPSVYLKVDKFYINILNMINIFQKLKMPFKAVKKEFDRN